MMVVISKHLIRGDQITSVIKGRNRGLDLIHPLVACSCEKNLNKFQSAGSEFILLIEKKKKRKKTRVGKMKSRLRTSLINL